MLIIPKNQKPILNEDDNFSFNPLKFLGQKKDEEQKEVMPTELEIKVEQLEGKKHHSKVKKPKNLRKMGHNPGSKDKHSDKNHQDSTNTSQMSEKKFAGSTDKKSASKSLFRDKSREEGRS